MHSLSEVWNQLFYHETHRSEDHKYMLDEDKQKHPINCCYDESGNEVSESRNACNKYNQVENVEESKACIRSKLLARKVPTALSNVEVGSWVRRDSHERL
jgi:hypothetical protein